MRGKKTNCTLLTFAFFIISTNSEAQFTSKYSVGVNLGTFIYSGDLTPSRTGSWKTPGFAWGVTGLRHVTPTLSARLDLGFGRLRGDEARYSTPEFRQFRAFAFQSRITEAILAAEWNPVGREKKFSPYVFAGVGYAGMKISRDYSHFNADYFSGEPTLAEALAQDAKTSLPKGVGIIPVGAGFQYRLNHKFSIHAEGSYRITQNDFIDGFSYSGNPDLKDGYSKISVGVRYSIGSKSKYDCPIVRD